MHNTHTRIAFVLLVIGTLGLIGVAYASTAQFVSHLGYLSARGQVVGSGAKAPVYYRGTLIQTYYLGYSYTVNGATYSGTWDMPYGESPSDMPPGTEITVHYPPGEPSHGQPVGGIFGSDTNIIGLGFDVLFEGFFPLICLAIGIFLFRTRAQDLPVLG